MKEYNKKDLPENLYVAKYRWPSTPFSFPFIEITKEKRHTSGIINASHKRKPE